MLPGATGAPAAKLAVFAMPLTLIGGALVTGLLSVKKTEFDAPPPGGGLLTITAKVPATARSGAVSVTVSWLLLTNVAARVIPLNAAEDEGTKPLPLIVSANEV